MKILVTGGNGQVGWELAQKNSTHFQIMALSHAQLDILNGTQVDSAISQLKPDIVVNAAAYTAVDKAEQEQAQAFKVNRDGPAVLASACAQTDLPFIHISTDYVFSGQQSQAYKEDDSTKPINVYGASKLAGEIAIREHWGKHIILRTSAVFSSHGHNFVKTILRAAQLKDTLSVVNDQITCPTSAADIAHTILALCEKLRLSPALAWGTYHYCSNEPASWHQFTEVILSLASQHYPLTTKHLYAINSSEYPSPAPRPLYSVLDCKKIQTVFEVELCSWRNGLEKVINQLILSPESAS